MVFFSLSATVVGQGLTAAAGIGGGAFLWIALIAGLLGLVFALFLAKSVLAYDSGTAEMQVISNAIREGAEAFMSRQYTTIAALAVVLAIALFVGYKFSDFTAPLAGKVVISFLIGAICSGLAGYTGMFVSIRTNIRAASAARSSLGRALKIALHGGAVTGLVVISLSLLGVGSLFYFFGGLQDPQHVPYQLVGFGFGASLVALFAQLGGGIYTKAADVGADLVGKVEAGIPEDDPRNPAVIADLVGDNVGDCAGRGADIFESTAAENVGAMILGTALYPVFGIKGILFPLIVHAINLVASFIGVLVVHSREDQDPMDALNRGYYVTTLLALAGFAGAVYYMLQGRWWLLCCGIVGIVTSFLFVRITEYYTETRYRPVQSIANASLTGPATNIISGLAVGMETPAMPVVVISAALLLSYYFGVRGLADTTISDYAKGIYGTAIATMGMLSSAAYILAMDTFGPITDNAGGIIEMSDQPDSVREKTDKLDAAGNTTKALTKGYAIGSAALAAFLLFSAYLETVHGIVAQRFSDAGQVLPRRLELYQHQPGQRAGFCGCAAGRDAHLPLLLLRHQSRRPHGAVHHRRCAGAVPRKPRHHGRHIQAGLWPLRAHRDRRCAQADGSSRRPRRAHAAGGGARLQELERELPHPYSGRVLADPEWPFHRPCRRGGRRRPAHGRNHRRHPDGHADEQQRRSLGQRQEVHRDRSPRWQAFGCAQSSRSGRYRRRSLQRHCRPSLHVLIKLLATVTLVLAPLFL